MNELFEVMDERLTRLAAGAKAKALGRGGAAVVERGELHIAICVVCSHAQNTTCGDRAPKCPVPFDPICRLIVFGRRARGKFAAACSVHCSQSLFRFPRQSVRSPNRPVEQAHAIHQVQVDWTRKSVGRRRYPSVSSLSPFALELTTTRCIVSAVKLRLWLGVSLIVN